MRIIILSTNIARPARRAILIHPPPITIRSTMQTKAKSHINTLIQSPVRFNRQRRLCIVIGVSVVDNLSLGMRPKWANSKLLVERQVIGVVFSLKDYVVGIICVYFSVEEDGAEAIRWEIEYYVCGGGVGLDVNDGLASEEIAVSLLLRLGDILTIWYVSDVVVAVGIAGCYAPIVEGNNTTGNGVVLKAHYA